MRRSCKQILLLSACFLLAAPLFGQQTAWPRIAPSGSDGILLLAGSGDVSEPILTRFIELAGGKAGRVVLIQFGEPGTDEKSIPEEAGRLVAMCKRTSAQVMVLRVDSRIAADDAKRLAAFKSATGAWLSATNQTGLHDVYAGSALANEVRELRKRGGIVGVGAAVELLGPVLLPDVAVTTIAQADLAQHASKHPGRIGIEIQADSAMLVRGRVIETLGSGEVLVHLPQGSVRPAERMSLKGRPYTDLTLLRRAARDRAASFPPAQVVLPVVEKGTLIIIGGGRTPAGLMKQFVDLAGGEKANIVLLPTAVPDPIPSQKLLAESLQKLGASVTVLPGRRLEDVESDAYLDAFRNATGIWFGGGRQWRFIDAYENTKVHKLMHNVLERGGVIAGSSAGASIQAEYMARGSPYGNLNIMAEGYERGLGFLKGVAIDQHFTQRRRQADMTALVQKFPQFLGIGIDEGTAIIVQGHTARVVGQGRTFFYDARRPLVQGQPDYDVVAADGEYDLKARKISER